MSKNKPWLKAKKRDGTTGAGKGDRYRPVDKEQYDKNYDAIFRKGIDKVLEEFKEMQRRNKRNDKSGT
jgi:hypothetical protein